MASILATVILTASLHQPVTLPAEIPVETPIIRVVQGGEGGDEGYGGRDLQIITLQYLVWLSVLDLRALLLADTHFQLGIYRNTNVLVVALITSMIYARAQTLRMIRKANNANQTANRKKVLSKEKQRLQNSKKAHAEKLVNEGYANENFIDLPTLFALNLLISRMDLLGSHDGKTAEEIKRDRLIRNYYQAAYLLRLVNLWLYRPEIEIR